MPSGIGGTPGLTSVSSLAAAVGNTPLVRIDQSPGDRRGYWAKLEGANPGGIKDRAALCMVRRARERGELKAGATIVESTSGTLGLGLALAGITYGHPVTVVTDPGMEPMMQRMLRAYGTRLDLVEQPDPVGGWQEARRQRVRDPRSRPRRVLPRSVPQPRQRGRLRSAG